MGFCSWSVGSFGPLTALIEGIIGEAELGVKVEEHFSLARL